MGGNDDLLFQCSICDKFMGMDEISPHLNAHKEMGDEEAGDDLDRNEGKLECLDENEQSIVTNEEDDKDSGGDLSSESTSIKSDTTFSKIEDIMEKTEIFENIIGKMTSRVRSQSVDSTDSGIQSPMSSPHSSVPPLSVTPNGMDGVSVLSASKLYTVAKIESELSMELHLAETALSFMTGPSANHAPVMNQMASDLDSKQLSVNSNTLKRRATSTLQECFDMTSAESEKRKRLQEQQTASANDVVMYTPGSSLRQARAAGASTLSESENLHSDPKTKTTDLPLRQLLSQGHPNNVSQQALAPPVNNAEQLSKYKQIAAVGMQWRQQEQHRLALSPENTQTNCGVSIDTINRQPNELQSTISQYSLSHSPYAAGENGGNRNMPPIPARMYKESYTSAVRNSSPMEQLVSVTSLQQSPLRQYPAQNSSTNNPQILLSGPVTSCQVPPAVPANTLVEIFPPPSYIETLGNPARVQYNQPVQTNVSISRSTIHSTSFSTSIDPSQHTRPASAGTSTGPISNHQFIASSQQFSSNIYNQQLSYNHPNAQSFSNQQNPQLLPSRQHNPQFSTQRSPQYFSNQNNLQYTSIQQSQQFSNQHPSKYLSNPQFCSAQHNPLSVAPNKTQFSTANYNPQFSLAQNNPQFSPAYYNPQLLITNPASNPQFSSYQHNPYYHLTQSQQQRNHSIGSAPVSRATPAQSIPQPPMNTGTWNRNTSLQFSIKCDFCPAITYSDSDMYKHWEQFHKVIQFKMRKHCTLCGTKYMDTNSLRTHLAVYHSCSPQQIQLLSRLSCWKCSRESDTIQEFVSHLLLVHHLNCC